MLTRANHPGTPENYRAFLHHELLDSKAEIERMIGKRVRYFAYPFGDHDADVIAALQSYGYEAAVSVSPGFVYRDTPLLRLKRNVVTSETTFEQFKAFLPP